ncbi:hypothetical protein [Streptomyces sp. NPDC002564]|uniref:hypothetical protein n=1 Tax=Streptomyces sp. NPDC002564 TaxID=3364649 RepID=UPI0036908532
MKITTGILAEAWRRTAAEHALLDGVRLPPVAFSQDGLEDCAEEAEDDDLCLLLDEDGTVRGHHGPYREVFATRDLDQVLYLIAESAVCRGCGGVREAAEALERIDPAWGRRFRDGGLDEAGAVQAATVGTEAVRTESVRTEAVPAGTVEAEDVRARRCDPLEGLAWIAGSWRDQDPYTVLSFFRAGAGQTVDPERLALLYGADPAQVAAGTRLRDLESLDGGRTHWDRQWESCCYGQAGGWTFLLHHDTPPGAFADKEAYAALGIEESVWLSATSAKAIYTFDYLRGGRRVDDDWGMLELIWYERGRAPYLRGGELDFLNRALRRAELDHPEVTNTFELYFHALETSLGLRLPRRDFAEGDVRAAYWAET